MLVTAAISNERADCHIQSGPRQTVEGYTMNIYDESSTPRESSGGGPAPASKISRYPALGDKPGQSTGCFLQLANGDILLTAAHPHSTFVLHAAEQLLNKG